MDIAIVCLDNRYLLNALYMKEILQKYTPCNIRTIIDEKNIEFEGLSDVEFFFIWNGIDSSVKGFRNIFQHLTLHTLTDVCHKCGHRFDEAEYKAYRLFQSPCPACNKMPDLKSNFLYIFSGPTLKKNADEYFNAQLQTRFWASVDADWSLFRCLVQAVTMIPHVVVMPTPPRKLHNKFVISHCLTPDESSECKHITSIKKLCEADKNLLFNSDSSRLDETDLYIDQIYSGVPSQHAINAMNTGIPTIVNLNKFYLSHYPHFPAILTNGTDLTDTVLKYLSNLDSCMPSPEYISAYVNKHFGPEKVANQWYHLARFILDPALFIDHYSPIGKPVPLPAYWAFQGGYKL